MAPTHSMDIKHRRVKIKQRKSSKDDLDPQVVFYFRYKKIVKLYKRLSDKRNVLLNRVIDWTFRLYPSSSIIGHPQTIIGNDVKFPARRSEKQGIIFIEPSLIKINKKCFFFISRED